MEPDRGGNGARLGPETPPSGPEVPVLSWSELERLRERLWNFGLRNFGLIFIGRMATMVGPIGPQGSVERPVRCMFCGAISAWWACGCECSKLVEAGKLRSRGR